MAQVLKEEIRQKILSSARDILIEKGYNGCTMRAIASAAGITVGNLYSYFDCKEAIYTQIVNTVTDIIDAVIVQKSAGLFSLYSVQTRALSQRELNTCSAVAVGVVELVPFIVKNHKKELMLLFHSANERGVKRGDIDILETIGKSLDLRFGTQGIGKYVLSGMFYAMEQVLLNETDDDLAIAKIVYIVKRMILEGELK